MAIVNFLFTLFYLYSIISVLYFAIFTLAGRIKRSPNYFPISRKNKFLVLIPAYKEDLIIIDTIKQALKQNYLPEYFQVMVIADSFKDETIRKLEEYPIRVVPVKFENSTKAKSINTALNLIPENQFDAVLILDADNIMEVNFLEKINAAMQQGFKVVQGHRVAKNLNTPFAVLDAASEEINNLIFRKGHRVLGLSSALAGSGMAFNLNYFKKTWQDIHETSGEDKNFELKLLKERVVVEYVENAFVFDEKVQNMAVLSQQRTRWIAVQLYHLKKYFLNGLKELFITGNIDYFDKVLQTALPPRIMLIGILPLITLLVYSLSHAFSLEVFPLPKAWLALTIFYLIMLLMALPRSFYNKKTFKFLFYLPMGIWAITLSFFRIRGQHKKFHSTPKSIVNSE